MIRLVAAFVLLAIATFSPAPAQDSGSVVGVWRYVAQTITEVQSGKVMKPFGDNPTGHVHFTKGGRGIFVLFGEGRQKPALPIRDEDKVKLFNTFAGGSATYKVEGNTITTNYETSWHELWTNTVQKRTFEIVGNKLTVTSAPAKNAAGVDVIFTIVLERVE